MLIQVYIYIIYIQSNNEIKDSNTVLLYALDTFPAVPIIIIHLFLPFYFLDSSVSSSKEEELNFVYCYNNFAKNSI
jgi:hypothetical protein